MRNYGKILALIAMLLLIVSLLSSCFGENKVIDTPASAIAALKEGNGKYARSSTPKGNISSEMRLKTAQDGQTPYAIIVTCSDSRVPAEYIFSAGIGDLFVVRTAGNVIGDFELGSIEYAVEHLGVSAIVVMGHTGCGAVEAALEGHQEGHIKSITDEIYQSFGEIKNTAECERLNIENSINKIKSSDIVIESIQKNKVIVTGAMYDTASGEVEFQA